MAKKKKIDALPIPESWEAIRCVKTENKRHLAEWQIRIVGQEGLQAIVGFTDEVPAEFSVPMEARANIMAAAPEMLRSCEQVMGILTAEEPDEWMRSQAYTEAPYHFLWKVINKAKGSLLCSES
jgi:hypothetical protein